MTTPTFTGVCQVDLMQVNASDASVIASARVSTEGAASRQALTADPKEAEGLIKFLMKNRHGTPFEHNFFTFYVKAPIFVFREFQRHRIGWSYNEMSGRYTELKPEFFLPKSARKVKRVEGTKVGQYNYEQDPEIWLEAVKVQQESCLVAWSSYQRALAAGAVPEVARMCLPVNIMSEMWASCNARSIMAFLSLRTERPEGWVAGDGTVWAGEPEYEEVVQPGEWTKFPSKPLAEIQLVADQIEAQFAREMPITCAAWNEFGRVCP